MSVILQCWNLLCHRNYEEPIFFISKQQINFFPDLSLCRIQENDITFPCLPSIFIHALLVLLTCLSTCMQAAENQKQKA